METNKRVAEQLLSFLLDRDSLRLPLKKEHPVGVTLSIATIRDYTRTLLEKLDFSSSLHDDISSIQSSARRYQRIVEDNNSNYVDGDDLLSMRREMATFVEKIAEDYGLMTPRIQELLREMRQGSGLITSY